MPNDGWKNGRLEARHLIHPSNLPYIHIEKVRFANMSNLSLILLSIVIAVAGQLCLKWGMMEIGFINLNIRETPLLLLKALISPYILLGLVLFFSSALSWLLVLSRVALSYAYPMVSIGYALTAILSWALFKENISLTRILGILVVCFGVILISRS